MEKSGAAGGTRTLTGLPLLDFESAITENYGAVSVLIPQNLRRFSIGTAR